MSTISTPALVLTGGGRVGTALYDNPSITNNNHASVYVIFADSTYEQLPRGSITVQSGGPWKRGTGPGQ